MIEKKVGQGTVVWVRASLPVVGVVLVVGVSPSMMHVLRPKCIKQGLKSFHFMHTMPRTGAVTCSHVFSYEKPC